MRTKVRTALATLVLLAGGWLSAVRAGEKEFVVYFMNDSAALTTEAAQVVEQARTAFAESHGTRVYLVGHADRVGSRRHNHALSRSRALAVAGALFRHGIAAEALKADWRGEDSPPHATPDETQEPLNRCVVVVVR